MRFEQIEDQLKNTLLLAQDSADKAHEQARRESELLMREAGQKSRDIVHGAHEEKQKLEMVLRDLHSAEQEARQRLRAMSTAILSHLDDTEQLVAEGSSNFRAIVQAHPEASELRGAGAESMADIAERAVMVANAVRMPLDGETAASAVERLEAADQIGTARSRRTDRTPAASQTGSLDVDVASSQTADAFFDTPPAFDPSEQLARGERARVSTDVE